MVSPTRLTQMMMEMAPLMAMRMTMVMVLSTDQMLMMIMMVFWMKMTNCKYFATLLNIYFGFFFSKWTLCDG